MSQLQFKTEYTRIPNELIDSVFCKFSFQAYEWRILWAVMRLTWGWGRKGDYISVRALAERTRISVGNVHRTLKQLEGKQILLTRKGKSRTWIEISLDYSTWNLQEKDSLFTTSEQAPKEEPMSLQEEDDIRAELASFKARMGW